MLPFCIAILTYCFWTLLGIPVLAALRFSRHGVRNLLMAPMAGAGVTLLATFGLNRLGWPIRDFGAELAAVLAIAAIALWAIYRPGFAAKSFAPFALLLLIAALLTFRPMFEFGFDWISYGNEDMSNYVLAADRVFYHGYWENPDPAVYAAGTDRSLSLWFLHVELGARSGAELLLAWARSIYGRATVELFMPLIAAFHLMLISAATVLIYLTAARRRAALLTMMLLAASAMMTLGALTQLIAQVLGLALVAGGVVVFARRFDRMRARRLIPYGVLAGIVVAALMVAYSEIVPFFALPVALILAFQAIRRGWKPVLAAGAIALGVAGILLGRYARAAAGYFMIQAASGLHGQKGPDVVFPYFVIPSGLANLWGLMPINRTFPEPWLSTTILIGAVLLAAAVAIIWRAVRRTEPAAFVAAIMMILAARLFFTRTDFGLFKLAMYIQPFLLGTLAVAMTLFLKRPLKRLGGTFLAILAAGGLYSQWVYVDRSGGRFGAIGAGLAEVPQASATHMVHGLADVQRSAAPQSEIVAETENGVIAKIEASLLRGHPLFFASDPLMTSLSGMTAIIEHGSASASGAQTVGDRLRERERETLTKEEFVRGADRKPDQFFRVRKAGGLDQDSALLTGPLLTVLNRRTRIGPGQDYVIRFAEQVPRNRVVFVSSQLSKPSTWSVLSEVSLSQAEPDVSFPGSTMAGLGQYSLFEVLRPSSEGYLALNLTRTYSGDGDSRLPSGEVLGAEASPLKFVGRGSARIFVSFRPRDVDGRSLFALDMLSPPMHFVTRRTGLMWLYGRDISLDSRRLSGFAREISYLSPEEFAAIAPPRSVAEFPHDLANPALEYSGIYEDGWVAEDSYFRLTQTGSESLRVAGLIPGAWTAPNRIRILEDGVEVANQSVGSGAFDLAVPGVAKGSHEIRIQFANVNRLGPQDPRPAAARLSYIGFGTVLTDIADSDSVTLGSGWYDFERYNGQSFRWARARATFRVNPAGHAWLAADIEPNSGGKPVDLKIADHAGKVVFRASLDGRREIRVPVQAGGELEFQLDPTRMKRSAADPRELAFRVFGLRLE